jgi:hypothetical protein
MIRALREDSWRGRWSAGLTLLDVLIGVTIMGILVVPLFQLFSVQVGQMAGAQRDILLHARALQRLLEEESRLNVTGFVASEPATSRVSLPGVTGILEETLSIRPIATCTGLWILNLDIGAPPDRPGGVARSLSLAKLVVDRDAPTRFPTSVR